MYLRTAAISYINIMGISIKCNENVQNGANKTENKTYVTFDMICWIQKHLTVITDNVH